MDTIQLSALVVGCTQVLKQVGLPSKYLPLVAVLVGIGVNLLVTKTLDVSVAIQGFSVALATTGILGAIDHRLPHKK